MAEKFSFKRENNRSLVGTPNREQKKDEAFGAQLLEFNLMQLSMNTRMETCKNAIQVDDRCHVGATHSAIIYRYQFLYFKGEKCNLDYIMFINKCEGFHEG